MQPEQKRAPDSEQSKPRNVRLRPEDIDAGMRAANPQLAALYEQLAVLQMRQHPPADDSADEADDEDDICRPRPYVPPDFIQDEKIAETELMAIKNDLAMAGSAFPPIAKRRTPLCSPLIPGEVIILREEHRNLIFTVLTPSKATCEIFDRVNHRFGNYAQRQFANGVLNDVLVVSITLVDTEEFEHHVEDLAGEGWFLNKGRSFLMLGTDVIIHYDFCERFAQTRGY